MAAIIREITPDGETITDSNRELLEHILTDLHAALQALARQGRLLDKHDALLEEFRPLLNQFRSPLATAIGRRRNGARQDPA